MPTLPCRRPVARDPGDARAAGRGWRAPALAYVLVAGLIALTSKLALAGLAWWQLVVWVALGYVVVTGVVFAVGRRRPTLRGGGAGWAAICAVLAVSGLVMLLVALEAGTVSRVVPVTAGYPAITLALSALFLHEPLTRRKIAGTMLVVGGVILIAASAV
ncbi:MAG: DMT family transporter [Solirubrobacteraceae bacterium]|nr:DMT family transporter [Solirubrobacteraceae bacterium]